MILGGPITVVVAAPPLPATVVEPPAFTIQTAPPAPAVEVGAVPQSTVITAPQTTSTTIVLPIAGPPGPAGDGAIDAEHRADTVDVHGIDDTTTLETKAGAQLKADLAEHNAMAYTDAHAAQSTGVHGLDDLPNMRLIFENGLV